ncbi:MAG: hypothetical protein AAGA68_04395 [Pseudomonadota bacterium]
MPREPLVPTRQPASGSSCSGTGSACGVPKDCGRWYVEPVEDEHHRQVSMEIERILQL